MACISASQRSSIDMLMYYSTIPHIFCNAFDLYTYEPRKAYYPLYWYGMFYDMEGEISSSENIENIYSLCGIDRNGKTLTVITHYTDSDNEEPKDILVDFQRKGRYEIYLLDKDNDGSLIGITEDLHLTIDVNMCIMIKEI